MPSIYLNGKKYSGSGTRGENGKNVVVAKVEPIIGGNRVTFSYFDDQQIPRTEAIEIMNGSQGVSIANARIEAGNRLILSLSDGNEIDAGVITVDPNNLNLTNYYDKLEIDGLLANQKQELIEYVDNSVDVKMDKHDFVTSADIQGLFP